MSNVAITIIVVCIVGTIAVTLFSNWLSDKEEEARKHG